jgi:hypothetical protein
MDMEKVTPKVRMLKEWICIASNSKRLWRSRLRRRRKDGDIPPFK